MIASLQGKRHTLAGVAIVLALLSAVAITRLSRGTPEAISEEPLKTRGPAGAGLTVLEFSDFACPYCGKIAPALKRIQNKFPSDVRLIFKHFPLKMHQPSAGWAAEAAECAGDQGKFWEYHDLLYAKRKDWYPKNKKDTAGTRQRLVELAKPLGLDAGRFQACVDSGEKAAVVAKNSAEGKKFMVHGTPTLILNYRKFIVSVNEKSIEKAITEEVRRINR